jgi:hypothetical protein
VVTGNGTSTVADGWETGNCDAWRVHAVSVKKRAKATSKTIFVCCFISGFSFLINAPADYRPVLLAGYLINNKRKFNNFLMIVA